MRKFRIVGGDITVLTVDVIVNAANPTLSSSGGVNGAIHRAGGPDIAVACHRLRHTTLPDGLPAGDAVATTAGRLHARWVVHTVGPSYSPTQDHSPTLRSAYTRSLQLAADLGAHTIAFPLISSGANNWPTHDAAHHAITALRASPNPGDCTIHDITLVAFSPEAHHALQHQL